MNDRTTKPIPRQAFAGALLGLALGDALAAPFEGGPLERLLWWFIGKTSDRRMRWTDDTQMSLDVAESLLAKATVDPDDLAARFAAGYRWSRGYGPAAAKLLKRVARGQDWRQASRATYPEGSYGNGGAMRAPVIGLFYADRPEHLPDAARLCASVTHAHPLAQEGAVLIASATALAAQGRAPLDILQQAAAQCRLDPFVSRLKTAASWLQTSAEPSPADVRRELGNGIAASDSCVTAVYIALRFMQQSFEDMVRFIIANRGDTDTIAAMAGAIWGAANGDHRLPPDGLAKLEQHDRIKAIALALYDNISC